jgi:hypothetical protein
MRRWLPALFLLNAAFASAARASEDATMQELRRRLDTVDRYSAVQYVLSQGGSDEDIAGRFAKLVRDLYWAEKGARGLVIIGQAGITFCLSRAEALRAEQPERSRELLGLAKAIAYDLGANTWRGWGDEGVVIADADRIAGYDAARLNLRLGLDLERPKDKIALAQWLLGAHEMGAGDFEAALTSFRGSAALQREVGDEVSARLSDGYEGITRILAGQSTEGQAQLDAALAFLDADSGDAAKFSAQQLRTAQLIFQSR